MNTIEDLTLGDIEEVEQYAGIPLASLGDEKAPKGKLMIGLAFVIKRRENPKFTLADAKAMSMKEINSLLSLEDPTQE
jgi:hypothetical protein